MKALPIRSLLILLMGAGLSLLCAEVHAQAAAGANDLVVYATKERTTFTVAVSSFANEGGDALPDDLAKIIANDLELSGFFRPPDNAQFANETERMDQLQSTINFAEWSRIGVAFLVRGSFSIANGELQADVKTYDTVSRNYVFGKRYQKYKVADARTLAHRISDDIIERLLGEKGNSGSKIIYIRQLDPYGKTKQVTLMDADGYGSKALTPVGELTATPAWGARSTEIYYTTYKDFNPDLAGLILGTNQSWWVSRRTGFNLSPSWSEARQLIALTLTKDGNSELYTMKRDGSDLRRLTTNRAIDSSPSWSRDGKKIAFTSDRTGNPQIYVMDVSSGEANRVTYHSTYNDGVSWSQAGPERLAFCSRVDDKFQIFTSNPDGSDLRQLTSGFGNNEDPSWAPNGQEVIFSSDRSGRKQLYRMFMDGSNIHQLTNGTDAQSPAWSPMLP